MLIKEEKYIDDEYIDSKNDPCSVEKITESDYALPDEEEIVEDDKIIYSLEVRSDDAMRMHDHVMEEKVLDLLRRGKLR